jgi:hypothetical protein
MPGGARIDTPGTMLFLHLKVIRTEDVLIERYARRWFATSGSSLPALHVFWSAQAKFNDKGFLSRDISVKEMIERGDIHHIFPRQYLKENGFSQSQYNQVANYVYPESRIKRTLFAGHSQIFQEQPVPGY